MIREEATRPSIIVSRVKLLRKSDAELILLSYLKSLELSLGSHPYHDLLLRKCLLERHCFTKRQHATILALSQLMFRNPDALYDVVALELTIRCG